MTEQGRRRSIRTQEAVQALRRKKSDKTCQYFGAILATLLVRGQPRYKWRAETEKATVNAGESTANNKGAGTKRAGKEPTAPAKSTISARELGGHLRMTRKRTTVLAD